MLPPDADSPPRVELRLLDPALLRALVDGDTAEAARLLEADLEPGWPDEHDEHFLRTWLDDPAAGDDRSWGPRALVLRSPTRRMIGHAGFHGPPGVNALGLPDAVELGYTVFAGARGLGYATEAARELIRWARETHGVLRFVTSVAPANEASLAVTRKLGFSFVVDVLDDVDGVEHVFVLETTSSSP